VIFSNGDLTKIKETIDAESREAPAKAGTFAPLEVWIRAGSTGLDPKQTAFFQALNIPTKIVKTQIEIQNDKMVIAKGQKVELTHCALLEKLNIRPFKYKMEVAKVFDNGQIFPAEVLDITSADIIKSMNGAIRNIAAFGMATGYVTAPAAAHMMANAFQNMVYGSHQIENPFPLAT
jgi:large subunit ribosomal protein LP0